MTSSHDLILHIGTAFLLGIGSSAHCMGMCGGIACALGLQDNRNPKIAVFIYNTGRIIAYALIALLLGSFLQNLQTIIPSLMLWLRTVAGLLLIAMALHTLQLWSGVLILEKAGSKLWRPVQKLARLLLPAKHFWQILLLGFFWGWLPCALVYSTLGWAVTQGSALEAATLMIAFGAGTAPTLLVSGMAGQQLRHALKNPAWRIGMAIALLICAAWTLYGAWHHTEHAHHDNTTQPEHDHHHMQH